MQYMEVNILMSIVTPPAETDVVLPATMSSVMFSKNAFLTEKGRGGEFHHVVPWYQTTRNARNNQDGCTMLHRHIIPFPEC